MKYRLGLHILFWFAYLLFESYIEFAWASSMYEQMSPWQRWWMAFVGEAVQLPVEIPLCYFIAYLINSGTAKFRKPFFVLLAGITAFSIAVVLQRVLIIRFSLPYLFHEK
ncbi:MAG: hypothetical protein ACXWV1_15575, partial [Chitinophagaceae bacterium]